MSRFTVRDIIRIMEKVQEEEARIEANPVGVRTIKDYILQNWWPIAVRDLYPNGITWEEMLEEANLLNVFETLWSESIVGMIFTIIQEVFDINLDDWEFLRQRLIEIIAELYKLLL